MACSAEERAPHIATISGMLLDNAPHVQVSHTVLACRVMARQCSYGSQLSALEVMKTCTVEDRRPHMGKIGDFFFANFRGTADG